MSDTALSEEAMLASLRGLRLPSEAVGGLVADVAVAVGLAALVALFAVALVRVASVRRLPADDLGKQIEALEGMPEARERVALLHLLKGVAPERFEALQGALYQPDGVVDLAQLRAEVARHV